MDTKHTEKKIAEAMAKIDEAKKVLEEAEVIVNTLEGRDAGIIEKARMDTLHYERNGITMDEAMKEFDRLDAIGQGIRDAAYTVRQGLRFFNRNN